MFIWGGGGQNAMGIITGAEEGIATQDLLARSLYNNYVIHHDYYYSGTPQRPPLT